MAAEQASALPSDRPTIAEQPFFISLARVDAAVQVEIVPKPAAHAGHADTAVQVVCPAPPTLWYDSQLSTSLSQTCAKNV